MGFCVGYFTKQASKKIAYYAGLIFMGLGFLAKMQYITINWRKIEQDIVRLIFRSGETNGIISYI